MPAPRRSARATSDPPTGDATESAPKRPGRRTKVEADPALRVAALRTVLFDTIEAEVRDGNVRVILWLADRLKLLEAQEEKAGPADELRALLEDLPPQELREFASLAAK